ncbi:MAG: BON domain-containing protein [Chloroflexota bacterium]
MQSAHMNRLLQARVEDVLERYIQPRFTSPQEEILASATYDGEVELGGLVNDERLVDEAIRRIMGLHGVARVKDNIIVALTGTAVEL